MRSVSVAHYCENASRCRVHVCDCDNKTRRCSDNVYNRSEDAYSPSEDANKHGDNVYKGSDHIYICSENSFNSSVRVSAVSNNLRIDYSYHEQALKD